MSFQDRPGIATSLRDDYPVGFLDEGVSSDPRRFADAVFFCLPGRVGFWYALRGLK